MLVFPESQPQYLLQSGIAYATRQFSKKNRPEDSRRIYISDVESADSMIESHVMSFTLCLPTIWQSSYCLSVCLCMRFSMKQVEANKL